MASIENELSGKDEASFFNKKFEEYLTVVSISLAILCAGASYFFYSKWRDAEKRVSAMEAQGAVVGQHSNAVYYNIQQELNDNLNVLTAVLDTNTTKIVLKGMTLSPSSRGEVFWNKDSQSVYLSINKLPELSKEKQYQLWALDKGKYVDAGVFNLEYPIHSMNEIESAEGFIVTAEKKGGAASPDLKAVYLKGKI